MVRLLHSLSVLLLQAAMPHLVCMAAVVVGDGLQSVFSADAVYKLQRPEP
jgi:hypothetical protein